MSNSRMAIRKKTSLNQFKFDFKVHSKGKAFLRKMTVLFFALSGVYLLIVGTEVWQQTWPVKKISLQGDLNYLTQKDIVEFMQQQPLEGMLTLDLQELQILAKTIDWVMSVEIRKVWPDELVFYIEEYQPVALFDGYVLTQQGTTIKINDSENFALLPSINLSSSSNIGRDKFHLVWQEFKLIKRKLELVGLNLQAAEIDDVNSWKLKIINGLNLNLGRKNRLERVGRLVDVFEKIKNKQQIVNIDLRYHNGLAVEWSGNAGLNQQKLKQKG